MSAPVDSAGGRTRGPLTVRETVFTVEIVNAEGGLFASEPRAAFVSSWKTLDDVRDLRGVYGTDRIKWRAAMDCQMADMRLRAAAPDLVEALECAVFSICARLNGPDHTLGDKLALAKVRAALAKARSQ